MFFSYKMPFSAVFWSVLSAASGQFSKKLLNEEYSNKALENVFKASIWLVVASDSSVTNFLLLYNKTNT